MTQQFDLFVRDGQPSRNDDSATERKPGISEDQMVRHLRATGRYRVLEKLQPRPISTVARAEFPLRGVILDTETTGLNHRKDEIIEIGTIAFTFDLLGSIGDVIAVYGGLQQPSAPIPAEITRDRDYRRNGLRPDHRRSGVA